MQRTRNEIWVYEKVLSSQLTFKVRMRKAGPDVLQALLEVRFVRERRSRNELVPIEWLPLMRFVCSIHSRLPGEGADPRNCNRSIDVKDIEATDLIPAALKNRSFEILQRTAWEEVLSVS